MSPHLYEQAKDEDSLPDVWIAGDETEIPLKSLGPDFLALLDVQIPPGLSAAQAAEIRQDEERF